MLKWLPVYTVDAFDWRGPIRVNPFRSSRVLIYRWSRFLRFSAGLLLPSAAAWSWSSTSRWASTKLVWRTSTVWSSPRAKPRADWPTSGSPWWDPAGPSEWILCVFPVTRHLNGDSLQLLEQLPCLSRMAGVHPYIFHQQITLTQALRWQKRV